MSVEDSIDRLPARAKPLAGRPTRTTRYILYAQLTAAIMAGILHLGRAQRWQVGVLVEVIVAYANVFTFCFCTPAIFFDATRGPRLSWLAALVATLALAYFQYVFVLLPAVQ